MNVDDVTPGPTMMGQRPLNIGDPRDFLPEEYLTALEQANSSRRSVTIGQVVTHLAGHGFPDARIARRDQPGDIMGVPGVYIHVVDQKRSRWSDWCADMPRAANVAHLPRWWVIGRDRGYSLSSFWPSITNFGPDPCERFVGTIGSATRNACRDDTWRVLKAHRISNYPPRPPWLEEIWATDVDHVIKWLVANAELDQVLLDKSGRGTP